VERLRRLQEQEKRAHNRLWEKEAKEHRAIHDHMSGVEGRISSIVEGRIIHIPVPAQPKKKKKPLAEEIQSIASTLDHGD